MIQDDGLIAGGVVTPQSNGSQIPSQSPSPTQGTGTEADLPRRPLPGYDKEAAIDTNMLGVEPIGVKRSNIRMFQMSCEDRPIVRPI